MTAFELIEALLAFQNRLDVQWGVFITVHLALFGGIIYIDRPLRRSEKAATMLIYLGFAAINYLVSMELASTIHAVQLDIAATAQLPCCDQNQLIQRISERVKDPTSSITQAVLLGSHGIMLILVLLSIFYDRSLNEMKNDN